MKKIFLFVLAIISCTLFIGDKNYTLAEIPTVVRVIYTNANVYSKPNVNDENTQIIVTYKYNQKLTTIGDSSIVGEDGYNYYKVSLNIEPFTEGYVLKSQVTNVDNTSPKKKLDANAKITEQTNIYVLNGNTFEKTEEILTSGTNVKILSGYNRDSEFTQIQYESEDGIITAYVKTQSLQTSKISRTLIGAIIIIITTISIVLIIFGIGKRKKRK